MLPIYSSLKIKQLDQYTIKHEPFVSIQLMERACKAFVLAFIEKFDAAHKVGIVCGTGNNGGDGLGIARLLQEWNYLVKVWIVRGEVKETDDFKENFKKLKDQNKVEIIEITSQPDQNLFAGCTILIDAIFGSGLSRPTEGIYAQVISCLNATPGIKVAIDMPSGLLSDQDSRGTIFKADYTFSFQLPKLAFLMAESAAYVGEWKLLDIALSKKFLKENESPYNFITQKDISRLLKSRQKFDHKGNYGHALLLAGSHGKMGACVLAAKAALRSGLGLLTVYIPSGGYSILQTAVPEAMVLTDVNDLVISSSPSIESFSAVAIGPGIGTQPEPVAALRDLLLKAKGPMIFDADALNIFSSHTDLQKHIPAGSILTPHPKEFDRLAGPSVNTFDRLERAREYAQKWNVVVLLKGAYTSINAPDGKTYFNSTGNPGMATGGSGDVLTGILTGLLAQGYSTLEAAIGGAYLHGLAGDLAARELGMNSLIASDLIKFLPKAFKKVE